MHISRQKKLAMILAIVLMICPYDSFTARADDITEPPITEIDTELPLEGAAFDVLSPNTELSPDVTATLEESATENPAVPHTKKASSSQSDPDSEFISRPIAQVEAHAIAESIRARRSEDHEIIPLTKEIWAAKDAAILADQAAESESVSFKLMGSSFRVFSVDGEDDPYIVPRTLIQEDAHLIAEIWRAEGYPESDSVIVSCKKIWAAEEAEIQEKYERRREEAEALHDLLYSGLLPYEITYDPSYEQDALDIADALGGEDYGQTDLTHLSGGAWEIVNRMLAGYGTIYRIVRAENQYNFSENMPNHWTDEYGENPTDSAAVARDVLFRAKLEAMGVADVGRTLPEGYLWHTGDGHVNTYRDACYYPYNTWDWSLPSPYYS